MMPDHGPQTTALQGESLGAQGDRTARRSEALLLVLALCAFVAGAVWKGFEADPIRRMCVSTDCAQQFTILASVARGLFTPGYSLLSPGFFFPEKLVLGISEAPIFQGAIFGALRGFGASPIFSWNLALALLSFLNLGAAYLCLRGERFVPVVSLFGAVLYAGSPWINEAVQYRAAFGPPMAWFFLSRAADEKLRRRAAYGLATIILLQFLASATLAVAVLFLVFIRLLFDPALRAKRIWIHAGLAVLPTVALGMWWGRVSGAALKRMGIGPFRHWVNQQLYFHADLIDFLPQALAPENPLINPAWPAFRPGLYALFPGWLILAAALIGVVAWWRRGRSGSPSLNKTKPAVFIVAGVAGMAAIHMGTALTLNHPTDGTPMYPLVSLRVLLITDAVWIVLVGFAYLGIRKGVWYDSKRQRLAMTVVLVAFGVLLALGPLIFAFGRPILVGPLAVLDALVPGLVRVRGVFRMLPLALVPLVCLAAEGARKLLALIPKAEIAAQGVFLLWMVLGSAPYWITPYGSYANAPEACPDCASNDMNALPLPYRYLIEHAPGEALFELPAGGGVGEPEGDSGLSGHDVRHHFYHGLHGIPILNGIASHFPLSHRELLEIADDFPAQPVLDAVRKRGAKWILVNGNRYPSEQWELLQRRLTPPPDGIELAQTWGPVWLYRVSDQSSEP